MTAKASVKALVTALMLCCGGCAESLTITATNVGTEVQFAFAPERSIAGIEVSDKGAQPGVPPICQVDRPRTGTAADREARFARWTYGRPLDADVTPSASCPPLSPGHIYRISVMHAGHCLTIMTFQIDAGGSVRELQPSDNVCWM